MPVQPDDIAYSIGEAADVLGVSIPTLRLYEHQGLLIPLRRGSGHRRYGPAELERVRQIRDAVHTRRYTLGTLRELFARASYAKPRDCMTVTSDHLPCWMHASHTLLERSTRCRACSVYAEVLSEL